MNFPHGVMVTLVSTTVTDDGLGNTTEETVTYEWGPCAIAPRYATESTDPRVAPLIVGKTVMGPPLDVDPADLTISVGGFADPARWHLPGRGPAGRVGEPVHRLGSGARGRGQEGGRVMAGRVKLDLRGLEEVAKSSEVRAAVHDAAENVAENVTRRVSVSTASRATSRFLSRSTTTPRTG